MSLNYNKIMLGGRLTADAELKKTPQDVSVCTFTVAVDRGSGDNKQTDFITCVAWRKTAEFVAGYFRKGMPIFVEGSLNVRKWTDQNDQTRYSTEVNVFDARFVESKQSQETPSQISYSNIPTDVPASDAFTPVGDDDLPF